MSGLENMTPPWERCDCVKSVGEMAVYVEPSCRAETHNIRGNLVVTKRECRRCDKDNAKVQRQQEMHSERDTKGQKGMSCAAGSI